MKQDRTLKTISIALNVAEENMMKIIDFLYELKQEDETAETYCKLSDYIYETLVTIDEKIKTL